MSSTQYFVPQSARGSDQLLRFALIELAEEGQFLLTFDQKDPSEATYPYDESGIVAGALLIASLPSQLFAQFHGQAAAAQVDQSFWTAPFPCRVTAISEVHAVAEETAATLFIQVTKDTGTDAPGAGDNLLTNNTNNGFDGKATANTVQDGVLTGNSSDLLLATGDRLSVDFSAAATELVGVTITVTLQRV